jgi:asparagine synthase (glutamine-hydrolysing)
MCGIAGIVDFQRAPSETVLRAMEHCLQHRGPDEGGVWLAGPAGLVHRRLRIIDLSPLAAQPMSNEDGRVRLIFNGEIYNHHALRQELVKLNHTFRSRSDTEVIVHGYESWGLDVIRRLRGMFALALWDEAQQRLVLARDRLGKKPLFYRKESSRLVFGSELDVFKAAAEGRPLRLSSEGFRQYLEYGYVLSPATILEEIWRLPAGHLAVWQPQGWKEEPYWTLPAAPAASRPVGNVNEVAQAVEPVLRDAVACRLESDVPLGCFLSGGIDSSLVAALAAENLGRPLQTYTVGFENVVQSEAAHARQVAKHLGADHHELPVDSKTLRTEFESILSRASEPLGDDSYVPTFLVSRETRRFVTVALSGDGGDELFAGYAKYAQFLAARNWLNTPLPWSWLARVAPNDTLHKRSAALATGRPLELARWLSSLWKREDLRRILARPEEPTEPDLFERGWNERRGYPEVERWMLTDMETYMEGDILTKVDRASMAVSLEARSPFLDALLVDEVLRWPLHAVLPGGGKAILKAMLGRRLPLEWFDRPKQGFGLPAAEWFRGDLSDVLRRCTSRERTRQRGLLNPECLESVVRAHLSGRRNFARKLYAVVAFELWAERFFGPGVALA